MFGTRPLSPVSTLRLYFLHPSSNAETLPSGTSVSDHSYIINFNPMATSSTAYSSALSAASTKLKIVDGWIMDKDDNLLIWVPDEYRSSLWCPGMLLLIGCEPTKIDFADARYGVDWPKCIQL